MKKTVLILMLGVLLIASNLFAADGDLIVEGNVGIGTGTPGAKLQIKGAASQSADLMSIVDSSDTSIFTLLPSGRLNLTTTNNTGFAVTTNFTGSSDIGGLALALQQHIVSDTNVEPSYTGIQSTISFAGTTANNVITSLTGSKNNIRLESASAISKTINQINGNTFSIRVSGASSTYNIGKINGFSLSPNYVSGTINVDTFNGFNVSDFVNLGITNANAFNITNQTGGENNTNILIGAGATGNWSIYNNSNYKNYFAGALGIGVGATNPGAYKLYVAGNAYTTGTWQTSDISFKQNINSIDNALDKVMNLKGVTYEWRKEEYMDKGFDDERHYGVVAQEVEKVLPETVKEGPDGRKGVAYTEIIPVLIEAVKEQQKIIEELKTKVQKLEAKDFVAKAQYENHQ